MDVPLPLRQFTMVPGQSIDPLFLCPLCHDSWADPVELEPCGDIFCKQCIDAARSQHAAQPMIMQNFQCPLCQTVLQSEKKPNRMLLNSVLMIEVECRYCHWRGTRESSEQQHTCTAVERAMTSSHNSAGTAVTKEVVAADPAAASGVAFSTAPALSQELPIRGGDAQASPSTSDSPLTARNGPRRAQREIEDGYIPIGDDPSSATLRSSRMSPFRDSVDPSHKRIPGETVSTSSSCIATSPLWRPSLPTISRQASGAPHRVPTNGNASHTGMSVSATPSPTQEPWQRYGLSQIEHDQLIGIFLMFDDGAGRLTHSQLRDVCFCMNFVQDDDDVGVIFASMDRECKGYVSQDDFLRWLSTHQPDPSALFGLSRYEYTDALFQFRSVDPEYHGVIDANSYATLCLLHGYAHTPEQAMRYFRLCDERNTGYVSLRQFLQALKLIKDDRGGDLAALPPSRNLSWSTDPSVGGGGAASSRESSSNDASLTRPRHHR